MRQLRSGFLILLGQLCIGLSPHKARVPPSFFLSILKAAVVGEYEEYVVRAAVTLAV